MAGLDRREDSEHKHSYSGAEGPAMAAAFEEGRDSNWVCGYELLANWDEISLWVGEKDGGGERAYHLAALAGRRMGSDA